MFLQQLLTELQLLRTTEQDTTQGKSAGCSTLNTPPAALQGAAHMAAATRGATTVEAAAAMQ